MQNAWYDMPMQHTEKQKKLILYYILAVVALIVVFVGWKYWETHRLLQEVKTTLENTTKEAQIQKIELEGLLAQAEHTNTVLSEALDIERAKVGDYEEEIEDITKTVDTLEKLSKTDKELLQKYSKVYFLNEHYEPSRLRDVPEKYLYDKNKPEQILRDVYPYLKDLLEEALDDGVTIRVASGYRSFEEQTSLKTNYKVVYGAGTANQFSADQGYSEHQLGTTVDFTPANGPAFVNFESTPEYAWLLEHAYKFGFVLSYPKGNAYYQFEPWHWRFVGEDLARDLHKDGKYFYDMDQRDIDKYLISIFD